MLVGRDGDAAVLGGAPSARADEPRWGLPLVGLRRRFWLLFFLAISTLLQVIARPFGHLSLSAGRCHQHSARGSTRLFRYTSPQLTTRWISNLKQHLRKLG